jgi:hypothetical protein
MKTSCIFAKMACDLRPKMAHLHLKDQSLHPNRVSKTVQLNVGHDRIDHRLRELDESLNARSQTSTLPDDNNIGINKTLFQKEVVVVK